MIQWKHNFAKSWVRPLREHVLKLFHLMNDRKIFPFLVCVLCWNDRKKSNPEINKPFISFFLHFLYPLSLFFIYSFWHWWRLFYATECCEQWISYALRINGIRANNEWDRHCESALSDMSTTRVRVEHNGPSQ